MRVYSTIKRHSFYIKKTDFKIISVIALILLLCTFFFSIFLTAVYAEEPEGGIADFNNTNLYDELTSADNFDFAKYPINTKNKTFVLQNFVEYCYSPFENNMQHYGLYIYLYNPSLIELNTKSADNKVQIAIDYDSEGKPKNYEKFALQFCSKIEHSDYKNLFYKFKVVDHRSTSDNKTIAERVNSNARRYDVSGVELLTKGSHLAEEYSCAKTYTYSGYAKGFGIDTESESTLKCDVQKLTTLDLKVEHTFYRTKTSNKGADYQNQIDTVYFSVPKEYFADNGNLQRIKAEWYEYKTKPILVTSNKEFYNAVMPFIGQSIGSYEKALGVYNKFYKNVGYDEKLLTYGFATGFHNGGLGNYDNYELAWNVCNTALTEDYLTALYYLLYCDDIEKYDPYADSTNDFKSNKLYDYILEYTKTYINGRLPIKNGTLSADLFESDIDDYRKVNNDFGKIQNGYSYYEFDADLDLKHLGTWQDTNPSFWDNWDKFGFWNALKGNIPKEDAIDLKPIVEFDYNDLKLSSEELISKYYVNAKDVERFKTYARKAQLSEEKVILFRFATSDYYSAEAEIFKGALGVKTKGQAYLAQESVFFNFDIIQLTFKNDDTYTTIPVVSSPIDIVDDPTAPPFFDNNNWWEALLKALKAIGIAILVVFTIWIIVSLLPIVWDVLKLVVFIVALPFKAIIGLFKVGKNNAEKQEVSPQNKKKVGKYNTDEAKLAKDRFKPKKE